MAILQACSMDGSEISPRGQNTMELLSVQSKFDMRWPMVTMLKRKLGYPFMAAEAHWILSGSDKLVDIEPWCPRYAQYSDDGIKLSGSYGPRVSGQLMYVAATLMSDPTTRQAVMTMWQKNPIPSKDIPCTISSQFLIRGGQLHLIQIMRSSDVWLGYPYDVFSFSMLALWLVVWLRQQGMKDLGLGMMALTAGSQHIYERNFKRIDEQLADSSMFEYNPVNVAEFQKPEEVLEHLDLLRNKQFRKLKASFGAEMEKYSP